jgi:putative membrane protein
MDKAALILAGLAGLGHIYIWVMESLTWRKPATWKRFGVASQEEAETQRTFAYNQGFYNLFLAAGALLGVACVVVHNGASAPGWTLIFFACSCMFGASLVLLSSGSGAQYARPAMMQGLLPLLAILAGIAAFA